MQDDGPPAGQFPDDSGPGMDERSGPPAPRQSGYQNRSAPAFDFKTELAAFYKMLDAGTKERGELERLLPSNVDAEMFVRVAKTAVQRVPDLLNPVWRRSLLIALTKAAGQGLLPDGKHGALIVRWDESAHAKQVCWQPMVWGIIKLGRLTGAIKTINAQLVFDGEEFDIEGGDELTFRHKVSVAAHERAYNALTSKDGISPDAFFDHVTAAYCVITATDGSVIRRWMPKGRLLRVRASSKAAKGPWNGAFCDEMALKTVILFASKWIETDIDTVEMKRFRAALEQDMDADFDTDDKVIEHQKPGSVPALPAPDPAMDNLTTQLLGKRAEAEKVPAATPEPSKAAESVRPLPQHTEPAAQPQQPPEPQPDQDAALPLGDVRARAFFDRMKQRIAECNTVAELHKLFTGNVDGVNRLAMSSPALHKELCKAKQIEEEAFTRHTHAA